MTAVAAYADGIDAAHLPPGAALRSTGRSGPDPEVLLGWVPDGPAWLATARGRTTMAGYALSAAVAAGRLRYLPVRLSAVPRLLASVSPDLAVVSAVRRSDGLAYGASTGIGPALLRSAGAVVVEVDPDGADLGGPPIDVEPVAVVDRAPTSRPRPAPRPPDEVDLVIGRRVASLLPERATIQLGPGGVADAIAACVEHPVALWSGLVTEVAAGLADRGLLLGAATAAYTWGGPAVARLAAEERLRLVPVDVSHEPSNLAGIDRFVACNTAIQVGLDGAVNVERVGGRQVAGIGGHADFAAGAVRSAGGMSVIALRSVTRSGASTIVPSVEVVSTARCDVEVVVTEHGVADLRGIDDRERAHRLAEVAAPPHRAGLREAAGRTRGGSGEP